MSKRKEPEKELKSNVDPLRRAEIFKEFEELRCKFSVYETRLMLVKKFKHAYKTIVKIIAMEDKEDAVRLVDLISKDISGGKDINFNLFAKRALGLFQRAGRGENITSDQRWYVSTVFARINKGAGGKSSSPGLEGLV